MYTRQLPVIEEDSQQGSRWLEVAERVDSFLGVAKTIFHVGWIPLIIYLGMRKHGDTPRPSILALFGLADMQEMERIMAQQTL